MEVAIRKKLQLLAVKTWLLTSCILYFLLEIAYCSSFISSPPLTFVYFTARVRVASFPRSFYHTPSICPPSLLALIMPHFTALTCAPFHRPLSLSLASIQRVKVEGEIDSKKDSHVMWRGTKEDPGGLGRLTATCFIPRPTATTHPNRPTYPSYRHHPK